MHADLANASLATIRSHSFVFGMFHVINWLLFTLLLAALVAGPCVSGSVEFDG